jgi:hypothetical protein
MNQEAEDMLSFLESVPPEELEQISDLIDQHIISLNRTLIKPIVGIKGRIKITYFNNLECCICYCDDKKTVTDMEGEPLKITEIDPEKLYNGLNEDFIVSNPCGDHSTCIKCLRTLSLDFTNHMINNEHSHIRCCAQDTCESVMGISTYFSHYHIKKILTPEEYYVYSEHAETYEFPGFCKKRCPNCSIFNIIPNEKIQENNRGELIVECAQSCRRLFCFYCDKIVYGFDIKICNECYSSNILDDPNMLNSYYYKRLEDRKEINDILYKNKELTNDIILTQLLEIVIDNEDVVIRCFCCLSYLYKTEQCNTLDHCKCEYCYSCGKIGEHIDSYRLGNHWSEYGIKGCPRFNSAPYWNNEGNCKYKCIERLCHDYEIGDCKDKDHQEGILNMKEKRKERLVYHKLKSLLREKRSEIISIAGDIDILKNYLPENEIFDDIHGNMDYYYYYDPKIWLKPNSVDSFDSFSLDL